MAAVEAPAYLPAVIETISPEDFETASIRSAAPSYTSDAPSYHSTVHNPEPVPPYTPPADSSTTGSTIDNTASRGISSRWNGSPAPLISSDPSSPPAPGLPPVPSGPIHNHHLPTLPTLGQFRIPSWSTISSPTARVALRRVAAASRDSRQLQDVRRMMLDRIVEEESHRADRERTRPLEDPYLVGEHAAAQARRERLARENGDEILIREDRRWDFFLGELSARRTSRGRLAMR